MPHEVREQIYVDDPLRVARGNEEARNAFYYLNLNTVRMKTGMIVNGLLGLGFSTSFPTAFLYGSFFVLAHEIAHGFDTRGAKYNKDGLLGEEWWKEGEKAMRRSGESGVEDRAKSSSTKRSCAG